MAIGTLEATFTPVFTVAPVHVPGPATAPDVAPPAPGGESPGACRCGHPAAAHEHFRAGADCGACGATRCGRYRPAGGQPRPGLRRRFGSLLGRVRRGG